MKPEQVLRIDEEVVAAAKKRGRYVLSSLAVLFVAITLPGFAKDHAWVAYGVMALLVGAAVAIGARIGNRNLRNTQIRITDDDALEFHGAGLSGAVVPLRRDVVRIWPVYRRSIVGTVGASWQLTNCQGATVSVPLRFYPDLPKRLVDALGGEERVRSEQAIHVGFPSAALRALAYLSVFAALLAVVMVLLRAFQGHGALTGAISAWAPIAAFAVVYLWKRNKLKSLGKGR